MFRAGGNGRQGQGRGFRHAPSELSYNSSTDSADTEGGEVAGRNDRGKQTHHSKDTTPLGNAPKRRMTFGGFRSDKKGEIYKAQRRPSFMEKVAKRAVGAAEAAVKATRLSIQGNNGQGFELVAIGVSDSERERERGQELRKERV